MSSIRYVGKRTLGEFKLSYLVLLSPIISTVLVDGMRRVECVLVLLITVYASSVLDEVGVALSLTIS